MISEKYMNRYTYDEHSGNVYYRKSGKIAGTKHHSGYIKMGGGKAGTSMNATRFIYKYMTGEEMPKGMILDHMNRVKDDNRWCNLRLTTQAENMRNMSKRHDNKSGYTGVYQISKKWISYINVNSERIQLGRFNTFDEAVEARQEAEAFYGFHEWGF